MPLYNYDGHGLLYEGVQTLNLQNLEVRIQQRHEIQQSWHTMPSACPWNRFCALPIKNKVFTHAVCEVCCGKSPKCGVEAV